MPDDGLRFWRGLLWAVPLGVLIWALLIGGIVVAVTR